MQDNPQPNDILATVSDYLRNKLMPQLTGRASFEVRLAANALDLVSRQIQLSATSANAERERLRAMLERDGDLTNLNRVLCDSISSGDMTLDNAALHDHLWATTLDKLAVDQPNYAAYVEEKNRPR